MSNQYWNSERQLRGPIPLSKDDWGSAGPHLVPEDYEIACFALSKIEVEAVLDLLDELYEGNFPSPVYHDSARLLAGRMCGRDVVVVTAAWQPEDTLHHGEASFSELARRIKVFFPNLLVGLIVGIVTGVPDLTQILPEDVRLGDVLVGLLEGEKTEQIAYHLSRERDEELCTPEKGNKRQTTNTAIQAAIGEIELKAPNDTHKFFHYYGALKTKEYKSGKYTDPGQNVDILYHINADGIEEPVDCAPRSIRQRTRICHGPIEPGKYYATQNARFWGRFKQTHDMGARLSVYVIRGVCNYGDGHENEIWQPYASAMAAAYAKTVLGKITPQHSDFANTTASGFERYVTTSNDRLH